MFKSSSFMFKSSLLSGFVFLNALPSFAEIPITSGEVRGGYTLDPNETSIENAEIIDAKVDSFVLNTPKGQLASPSVRISNPRNLLAPFLASPRGSATVDLSGTAFTPNGEIVMFSGVPTTVNGFLDPSSVVGADTLNPSGRVIIDSGTFNVGKTTVTSNSTTYQDSTLSFEVILPGTDLNPEPGPVIDIPGIDEPPTNPPANNPNEPDNQSILDRIKEQRAAAEREQSALQSRLNELAMQKATAANEQATLEGKLVQLERQKNISEREKQALNDQLNSYKSQEANIKDDIELLKDRIEALNRNKSTVESNNEILKQREQRLVDSINKIVDDKTLESEIQKLEDEMNSYGKKIDRIEKAALFAASIRKKVINLNQKNNIQYSIESLPSNSSIKESGKLSQKIIEKIVYFPLKQLFKYVQIELTASNIADWRSGASQAIADAKLQISVQKADAVEKLSKSLKETRSFIKQNQELITQIDEKSQQLQLEVTSKQEDLNKVGKNIQQGQNQISVNDQEIAQVEQSIVQTKSEISIAQQEAQKAELEAKQVEEKRKEAINIGVTGRADTMPSNIFPVTSMKQ